MKDDRLYLIHIQECLARVEQYTVGGRDAFLTSTLIQDGVLRNLHTLTESSQRLSGAFKTRHPEVNWREMAGFRNVLVHDYLGVDVGRIWEIIQQDLPELMTQLQPALQEPQKPPPAGVKRSTKPSKPRAKQRTTRQPKRPRKRKK